jgi:hypothetical protein
MLEQQKIVVLQKHGPFSLLEGIPFLNAHNTTSH